jgi:putative ABC transport system permease protein
MRNAAQPPARRRLRAAAVFALLLTTILGGVAGVFGGAVSGFLDQLPGLPGRGELWVVMAHDVKEEIRDMPLTPAEFFELEETAGVPVTAFSARLREVAVSRAGGRPVVLTAASVYESFFAVFPASLRRGGGFEAGDSWFGSEPSVVVNGEAAGRLGGEAGLVGTPLVIDGNEVRVRGVGGARWGIGEEPEVWLPLRWSRNAVHGEMFRRARFLRVLARTGSDAQAEQLRLAVRKLAAGGEAARDRLEYEVLPYREWLLADIQKPLSLSVLGVVCLILAGCGAVGLKHLSFIESSRNELLVRYALGASSPRLALVSFRRGIAAPLAGAAAGAAAAVAAGRYATVQGSIWGDSRAFVEGAAFWVAGMMALLVVVVLLASLAAVGWRWTPTRWGSLQAWVLRLQIGVSVAVLAATVTLGVRLFEQARIHLGFDPEHVVSATVVLPIAQYGNVDAMKEFYERLQEELSAERWATAAALVDGLPTKGIVWTGEALLPAEAGEMPSFNHRVVLGDYPRVMGLAVVRGAWFPDEESAPVVAVNREAARVYFGGADRAVGKTLGFVREGGDEPQWYRVTAVVENERLGGVTGTVMPEVFEPYRQDPQWNMFVTARVRSGAEGEVRKAMEAKVAEVGAGRVAMSEVTWLADEIADVRRRERFLLSMLSLISIGSLLLVFVGVVGAADADLRRRQRETGIRLAVGASPRRLVLGQQRSFLRLAVSGCAAGLSLLWLVQRIVKIEMLEPWPAAIALSVIGLIVAGATHFGAGAVVAREPARLLE